MLFIGGERAVALAIYIAKGDIKIKCPVLQVREFMSSKVHWLHCLILQILSITKIPSCL
jgi:hypothetical protein